MLLKQKGDGGSRLVNQLVVITKGRWGSRLANQLVVRTKGRWGSRLVNQLVVKTKEGLEFLMKNLMLIVKFKAMRINCRHC